MSRGATRGVPAAARAASICARQISSASCSTQPGCGYAAFKRHRMHRDALAALVVERGARAGGSFIEREHEGISAIIRVLRSNYNELSLCSFAVSARRI